MTATRTAPELEIPTRTPRPWNVVLLDDDDHTAEFVIRMVQELFGHPFERAFQIAKAVDTEGRAVCVTTHRELAELKQEQVHSYGGDERVATCCGAMSAVIEPADLGSDDESGHGSGDGDA